MFFRGNYKKDSLIEFPRVSVGETLFTTHSNLIKCLMTVRSKVSKNKSNYLTPVSPEVVSSKYSFCRGIVQNV